MTLGAVRELRHEAEAQPFETLPGTLAEVIAVWAVDASHLKSQI